MENYILNNYLKWHKDNKKSTIKEVIKLPIVAKILLLILGLSLGTGSIMAFMNNEYIWIICGCSCICFYLQYHNYNRLVLKP